MKTYKFYGQKVNETELREMLDQSLSLFIQTINGLTIGLQDEDTQNYIKETENLEYKSSLGKTMIGFMNNAWDKGMAKENKRNDKAIAENDLAFFAKDVEKSLKTLPNYAKTIENLVKQANQAEENDDSRYACEILKYLQRSMSESKKYYEKQKEYNQNYLEDDREME